jgi:hypothetical protein
LLNFGRLRLGGIFSPQRLERKRRLHREKTAAKRGKEQFTLFLRASRLIFFSLCAISSSSLVSVVKKPDKIESTKVYPSMAVATKRDFGSQ